MKRELFQLQDVWKVKEGKTNITELYWGIKMNENLNKNERE